MKTHSEKRDRPHVPCPNLAQHTDQPTGYLAWHSWADRMAKAGWNNDQPCPGCGKHQIWVKVK